MRGLVLPKVGRRAAGAAVLVVGFGLALTACHVPPARVNVFSDSHDQDPGNGVCADSNGLCSLRAAFEEQNAAGGHEIKFAAGGTYTLTLGAITVNNTLNRIVVNAAGLPVLIVNRNTVQRVFNVDAGATLDLTNVNVTDSQTVLGDGGVMRVAGTVTVHKSSFYNNSANGAGGAIAVTAGGTVVLENSTLADNMGHGLGGETVANWGTFYAGSSTITGRGNLIATETGATTGFAWSILATDTGGICFGPTVPLGHNVYSDASCTNDATDLINTDAELGPLTASHVRIPAATSPALDRIPANQTLSFLVCDGTSSDQVRTTRPLGTGCDAGAIERSLPTQPSTNVVAVGSGAFTSADNGVTWAAATTQPPGAGSLWAVASNGANVVAVGAGGLAFTSADHGANWAAATTQPAASGAGVLKGVASNGANFVAVDDTGKAFRSADYGVTWAAATTQPPGAALLSAVTSNGANFVAVGRNSVTGKAFISADNGNTWAAATTQPTIGPLYGVASNGANVVAVAATQEVMTSADNGANWTHIATPFPDLSSEALVAVASNDANFVAVDRDRNAYTSTDNGATWAAATTQPPGSGSLLAVASNGANFVAVGVEAFRSADNGNTWAAAATRIGAYAVAFTGPTAPPV